MVALGIMVLITILFMIHFFLHSPIGLVTMIPFTVDTMVASTDHLIMDHDIRTIQHITGVSPTDIMSMEVRLFEHEADEK